MAEQRASVEYEPWLDSSEAARYIASTTARIYELVRVGQLRAVKDGRRLLFRKEWLDEALEPVAPSPRGAP